ncbi:MAG: hypothetical protein R3Y18_01350 [Bacillota bacterium]
MKFQIVVGNKNEFLQDMEKDVKRILSNYPHKLSQADCGDSKIIEVQSESKTFEIMKEEVLSRCVSYLLYYVKMRYYKSNIKKFTSKCSHFIMLKVLVFSDFDKERDEILSKITNANRVVLDGVYNFLIKPFEIDWQRGATVIGLSVPELKNADNFKEFVKSMSCTISSKYQILYLFCGVRNMVLSDKLEKVPAIYLESENLSGEEKIISTLIENYPMNVAIYEEAKDGIVSEALGILFDVRKNSKSVKSV